MTRTWISQDEKRWTMQCDMPSLDRQCYGTDSKKPWRTGAYLQQPDLQVFVEIGWYVAKSWGDMCPECNKIYKPIQEPWKQAAA